MHPFLDEKQILRVGGRLTNSNLRYDQKHPILLPARHKLTELIFQNTHVTSLHCGAQLLLATVRQRFWPISGMSLAKKTVRNCIRCFRVRPKRETYIMGNLPADRLAPGKVFNVTGTDFCGPFLIKETRNRNRRYVKVYMCVFVCYTTRACHLELVGDLTSESFIAAFKRFVARRGKCEKIYSDNGTNFVGANREMREFYNFLNQNGTNIFQNLRREGITWIFSPSRTPNFGGLFEACVKSAKAHLRRVIGENKLTYEEFLTIMTQVEACLNSRPLSPLSSDPNDPSPLTPGHFLVGAPLTAVPEPDWTDTKMSRLSRWQLVQNLTQHFWKRWSLECIAQLQKRTKWKTNAPPLAVGDLVIIQGETTNPLQWPTGRVLQCHSGNDGVTRVVTLKTANGVVKRGVTKLFRLPIPEQVSFEN